MQREAAQAWTRPEVWWPMVARNIANSGRFSSDRTIQDYADEIWRLSPVRVTVDEG